MVDGEEVGLLDGGEVGSTNVEETLEGKGFDSWNENGFGVVLNLYPGCGTIHEKSAFCIKISPPLQEHCILGSSSFHTQFSCIVRIVYNHSLSWEANFNRHSGPLLIAFFLELTIKNGWSILLQKKPQHNLPQLKN